MKIDRVLVVIVGTVGQSERGQILPSQRALVRCTGHQRWKRVFYLKEDISTLARDRGDPRKTRMRAKRGSRLIGLSLYLTALLVVKPDDDDVKNRPARFRHPCDGDNDAAPGHLFPRQIREHHFKIARQNPCHGRYETRDG